MAEPTTFEVEGVQYEIVYALKRIEMAEAAMGNKSIMAVFNSDSPTIRELVTMLAYGIRESGRAAWVNPTKGIEIAEKLIETKEGGYVDAINMFVDAAQRDCAFLFPKA